MAPSPKEKIAADIIASIKADTGKTEQREPPDSSKTSNSQVQVPRKGSCSEPTSLYPLKPQVDAKAEDGHSQVPLIPEELPTNKSRLSPLAARAALASLVSTAHDGGANGTESADHHLSKTLPITDYTSSGDPSTLNPVSGVLDVVKRLSLDEDPDPMNSQLEDSTALKGPRARSKRSTVSTGLAKTGRVTRSSTPKANSSPMDAGAIPRSTSTGGQDCPLTSGFDDKANVTSKEGEKDVTSVQAKTSSKSNRRKRKKSTATPKQEQEPSEIEDGMGNLSQEAGDQTTTVSIDDHQTEGKRTGQSAKRKLDVLQTPARVTRSAVKKSPGNANTDVQVKSSNEGASKKRSRSTRSTGLEKTDDFTGSQGLDNDNSVQSTKADDSQMNVSQTGSVLAQKKKKEPLSPRMDLEEQAPPTKEVKGKPSSSSMKAQQTEGTSRGGRKEKSPEQKTKSATGKRDKKSASKSNRRFSHRLHFLPRTRSQVKS